MKLFALFLIFYSSYSLAELNTSYKWIKSSEKLTSGKCFEVDTETSGEKYIKKVTKKKCKPAETNFVFLAQTGKCYELDIITGGEKYIVDANLLHCHPAKTTYYKGIINNKYSCFRVDSKTKGQMFYERVKDEHCNGLEEEFFWKAKSKTSGDCYVKGTGNQVKKVSSEKCLPKKTVFTFYRVGPKKGECHQQDASNPLLYTKKSNIQKCKPQYTIFIFLKDKNKMSGKCFELDEETKGDVYLNRVKPELCK